MNEAKTLSNRCVDPLPVYRFRVYIKSLALGFSKITNLVQSVETEPLQEGGVNDRVYNLLRSCSAEHTLILERGVASRVNAAVLEGMRLAPGQRLTSDVLITVHDRTGSVARVYVVQGATVRKISFSDLNAASGDLLIEQIELVYEALESYPLVSQS